MFSQWWFQVFARTHTYSDVFQNDEDDDDVHINIGTHKATVNVKHSYILKNESAHYNIEHTLHWETVTINSWHLFPISYTYTQSKFVFCLFVFPFCFFSPHLLGIIRISISIYLLFSQHFTVLYIFFLLYVWHIYMRINLKGTTNPIQHTHIWNSRTHCETDFRKEKSRKKPSCEENWKNYNIFFCCILYDIKLKDGRMGTQHLSTNNYLFPLLSMLQWVRTRNLFYFLLFFHIFFVHNSMRIYVLMNGSIFSFFFIKFII